MIMQLFPGRTRNQVKLKYKMEERKHPLRLFEASTNRAKGEVLVDHPPLFFTLHLIRILFGKY